MVHWVFVLFSLQVSSIKISHESRLPRRNEVKVNLKNVNVLQDDAITKIGDVAAVQDDAITKIGDVAAVQDVTPKLADVATVQDNAITKLGHVAAVEEETKSKKYIQDPLGNFAYVIPLNMMVVYIMNIKTPGVKLSDQDGHVWLHAAQPSYTTHITTTTTSHYQSYHHQEVQHHFEDDDADMWKLVRVAMGLYTLTNSDSQKRLSTDGHTIYTSLADPVSSIQGRAQLWHFQTEGGLYYSIKNDLYGCNLAASGGQVFCCSNCVHNPIQMWGFVNYGIPNIQLSIYLPLSILLSLFLW